jgi:UDP-N-acetylmuramoyl-tripeptide--D-alanyl-D-alanine ligase
MLESYFDLPCYLIFLWFALRRLMTYLHIFQQEEYDNKRFIDWILENRVFDKKLSAALLAITILSSILPGWLILILMMAAFAGIGWLELDPREKGKKKLSLTQRARRILGTSMVFTGIISFFVQGPLFWIIMVQILPLMLPLANLLLALHERKTQKKFYDEAVEKLKSVRPNIVAVTGSFGKTSIKHILGHILKTAAPTIITPGSVNTVMGITRIIREQLEPHHRYFVVEMGAYGPGSIETLCKLTPPDFGIISAIGHAHYERFKTLETVAQAKYELAQAVMKKNGKTVVHDSTLRFPYTKLMAEQHAENFIICGDLDTSTVQISSATQDEKGLTVTITWDGKDYTLKAPLYGLHHGQNMALAFTAAVSIGMTPEDVIAALATTPQITHRLELKPQPDGSILIDDAYNSNPQGFKSGLDLLKTLKKDGRAILITPGMVELGAAPQYRPARRRNL